MIKKPPKLKKRLILSSVIKGFSWTLLVTLLSAIPLLLVLLAGSINPDVTVGIMEMLKSGSILFIATAISGAAWVDIIFSKVKSNSFTRILSNIVFVSMLLLSTAIFATAFSANVINTALVYLLSQILVIVGFSFSLGIKSLLFLFESLKDLKEVENQNRIIDLENQVEELEFTDYEEIDDKMQPIEDVIKKLGTIKSQDDALELKDQLTHKLELEKLKDSNSKLKSELIKLKKENRDGKQ